MKLRDNITDILSVTAELRKKLAAGEWQHVSALLEERGRLLDIFAESHDEATAADLAACSSLLSDLRRADKDLQQIGRTERDQAASDWQRSLGQAAAPRHDYDRSPDLACLDRRA